MANTRAQEIAEHLRKNILSGTYLPGSRLHEETLAEETGVSRTPIRAALRLMDAERLVNYFPNRGYVVRKYSPDQIRAAYQTRAVLEGLACRQAVERGIPDALKKSLKKCITEIDVMLEKGSLHKDDVLQWRHWNAQFHGQIIEASGNESLAAAIDLVTRIPMVSNSIVVWSTFEVVANFHEHHRQIHDLLCRGLAGRAEFAMREHIEQGADFIVSKLIEAEAGAEI